MKRLSRLTLILLMGAMVAVGLTGCESTGSEVLWMSMLEGFVGQKGILFNDGGKDAMIGYFWGNAFREFLMNEDPDRSEAFMKVYKKNRKTLMKVAKKEAKEYFKKNRKKKKNENGKKSGNESAVRFPH